MSVNPSCLFFNIFFLNTCFTLVIIMFLAKWKGLLVRNSLSMGYRFDSWYCQFICFKWGSVMLDRFKPALNRQMEKYAKGKQGGCTKAQDFCPQPLIVILGQRVTKWKLALSV